MNSSPHLAALCLPLIASCAGLGASSELDTEAIRSEIMSRRSQRDVAPTSPVPSSYRAVPIGRPVAMRELRAHIGGMSGGTWIFPVADLLHAPRSFPAPEMNVWPSGMERDAEAAAPYAGSPTLDPDLLVDLIRSTIDPDSWDEPGRSIEVHNGLLIIRR